MESCQLKQEAQVCIYYWSKTASPLVGKHDERRREHIGRVMGEGIFLN